MAEPGNFYRAPVSAGELVNRISILRIKQQRINDEDKLLNVERELAALEMAGSGLLTNPALQPLIEELQGMNEALWEIEDALRECEQVHDFSEYFIRLARSVYITKDERTLVKHQINMISASTIVEEKNYAAH